MPLTVGTALSSGTTRRGDPLSGTSEEDYSTSLRMGRLVYAHFSLSFLQLR